MFILKLIVVLVVIYLLYRWWLAVGAKIGKYIIDVHKDTFFSEEVPEREYPPEDATADGWLTTMVYSWGGDTPNEVFWTLSELTNWVNSKTALTLEPPTEDLYFEGDDEFDIRLRALSEALEDLAKQRTL